MESNLLELKMRIRDLLIDEPPSQKLPRRDELDRRELSALLLAVNLPCCFRSMLRLSEQRHTRTVMMEAMRASEPMTMPITAPTGREDEEEEEEVLGPPGAENDSRE